MATGISLHIGLNAVNPAYYDGSWNGKLKNAVQDAKDMQAIATQQGFQATVLIDNAATREAVISSITQSSQRLHAGDMFFVSFAGHGGVLPDFSGDEADQRVDFLPSLKEGDSSFIENGTTTPQCYRH